jgi:hypothetical protein
MAHPPAGGLRSSRHGGTHPSMAAIPVEPPLPPAVRRILEIVYGVEGVVAARVWHAPDRVSVGVRGGTGTPADLLHRVESAVSGLKHPGVQWDFGLLEDG